MTSAVQAYDKILAENIEIVEKRPKDVASLYNCGTLLLNYKRDYARAAEMFNRVLEIDKKVMIFPHNICASFSASIYLSIYLSMYLSMYVCMYVCTY